MSHADAKLTPRGRLLLARALSRMDGRWPEPAGRKFRSPPRPDERAARKIGNAGLDNWSNDQSSLKNAR
jgi:hypothetical protein